MFAVLVDNGYESKKGYSALDRLIKCFWSNIDIDFLKGLELRDFQFSPTLRNDFESIMVDYQLTEEQYSGARLGSANLSEYLKIKQEKDRMKDTLVEKYTSKLSQESQLLDRLIDKTSKIDDIEIRRSFSV